MRHLGDPGQLPSLTSNKLKLLYNTPITKLVYNSNVTMVYDTYNELVTGAYKPTYNWGASHCKDYKSHGPFSSMIHLILKNGDFPVRLKCQFPREIQRLQYIVWCRHTA